MCWKRNVSFLFFLNLLTSLKHRVLWITWTLRLEGKFSLWKCHFALSRAARKKARRGSLLWLIYQRAKQESWGAGEERAQHQERVLSWFLWCCPGVRKLFAAPEGLEKGTTHVWPPGVNRALQRYYGASLPDLLLEKQAVHHANVFLLFEEFLFCFV